MFRVRVEYKIQIREISFVELFLEFIISLIMMKLPQDLAKAIEECRILPTFFNILSNINLNVSTHMNLYAGTLQITSSIYQIVKHIDVNLLAHIFISLLKKTMKPLLLVLCSIDSILKPDRTA